MKDMSKRIAIDFDETYSADPAFFRELVALARKYQHLPCIVSCRRNTPENHELIEGIVGDDLLIVLTDLKPKRAAMEAVGLPVDWWVDDHPESVKEGR